MFQLRFLILFSSALLLTSCALFDTVERPSVIEPLEDTYNAPFENVWRATQLALAKYPLRVNNIDIGVIETEFIRGPKAWHDPDLKKGTSGGRSYRLKVRLIRGKNSFGSATKVSIYKEIKYQKNFFSNAKVLPSSGLEELTLLYRIDRELLVEKTIERVQAQKNY